MSYVDEVSQKSIRDVMLELDSDLNSLRYRENTEESKKADRLWNVNRMAINNYYRYADQKNVQKVHAKYQKLYQKSIKENIISLIIEDGAVFEDEITFFLSQEVRSIATYGKVMNAIAAGATRLNEIATKSGIGNTGTTSKYLDLLMTLGIVEREYCFGEKTNSRKTIYQIKDQLFNFHYQFIEKNQTRKAIMTAENFYNTLIEDHLDQFVSFEFEKVCRDFLKRKYQATIEEIGRYWYNESKSKKNIEIDIVMKESGSLYAFECKWTNSPLGVKVLNELEEKTKHLSKGHVTTGLFSRSGYSKSIDNKLTFTVNDLYNV